MDFLDRIDELQMLEDRWSSDKAELIVVWGRRRVGKTELIDRFIDGHRGVLFEATSGTTADQLRDFSRILAEAGTSQLLREQSLDSWSAALAAIAEYVTERTVVAIDEFQYVVQADPEMPSLLSRWWRETGRALPLVLILSGSEVSFFERDVLGHGSPLYGRRTAQMRIEPFTYRDAALFTPKWSDADKIRAAAIWGGMPYYLEQIDPRRSLNTNIVRTVLSRDGVLREEARLLLFQELSEPRLYFSVLRSLAGGDTRVSEISNRTGSDTPTVSRILDSLQSLGLVRRLVPVGSTVRARTKQTAWEICDPYLRFWFRFVLPFEDRLQSPESQKRHFATTVRPRLDEFVSKPTFERIAQEYVRVQVDSAEVGSWWGRVPTGEGRKTELRELDVVALREDRTIAALGTCKWTSRAMGVAEDALITRLEPHIGTVRPSDPPLRCFFSKSGFTKALRDLARDAPEQYRLVEPEDLYA